MVNERIYQAAVNRYLVEHFDANETAFLARQLEQVRTKLFQVEYPALKGRGFFPLASDIASSANDYIYFVYDKTGKAKVAAPGGNDDFPRVEVSATERSGKVRQINVAYGWFINEMREAARVGVPLTMKKAEAASEAAETLIDNLLATGQDPTLSSGANTALAIPGFVNNTDIEGAAGARIVSLPIWNDSTTGQAMLDGLNKLVKAVPDGSGMMYYPDTVVLPTIQYTYAATKRLNEFDQRTVMQAFLAGNPWVKTVDFWLKLDNAGAGGLDRAVAYKKAADVVEAVIPQEFETLAPQPRNDEFVVPCTARCGGVKVYKPLACVYGDFASS